MYQLTCRARARGHGLVPVAAARGSPDPAAAGLDRWTIFIHGFNNSKKAAAATWRGTSEELLRCEVDLGAVVLFYWPGDYSRWEVWSAMNYPKTVPIAEETAKRLAWYLQRVAQDRHVPLQLSFVAHSLGALVVLETIRLLRIAFANVMVHDVLLMAAAVPEGFCMPGETYGAAFSSEANEVALYSLDDGVLKRFFRVGQKIAKRFPENRQRAVGRSGGPGAGRGQRWSASAHMDGFGHGDYWKKSASMAEIARIVVRHGSNSIPASDCVQRENSRESIRADDLSIDVIDEDEHIAPEVIAGWRARPFEF